MSHPYETQKTSHFWRSAVGSRSPFEIDELWSPKFQITPKMIIATAGSCFAQHFSRALVARGYNWKNFEPGPGILTDTQALDYHYNTFSFRTGNIYTPKMLLQWLTWAFATSSCPDEVWEQNGRFFDPFRPAIEPGGFETKEDLLAARESTFAAIRNAVTQADVFVFTMGLTESWRSVESGMEYAICPGTAAGTFDPKQHEFHNHSYKDLHQDMVSAIKFMARRNKRLKFLLTVSPVPLTATATNQHILLATSQSKSRLRTVAGDIVERFTKADYFPSYEIVTSPAFRGMFFAPNMRHVVQPGVNFIMETFFRDQTRMFASGASASPATSAPLPSDPQDESAQDDIRCEEEFLEAFGK